MSGLSFNYTGVLDTLHLCYGWTLLNTPSHCVCGASFTTDHAVICPYGGLAFMRHHELRDIKTQVLPKVCNDVTIEPPLKPLSRERLTHRQLINRMMQ